MKPLLSAARMALSGAFIIAPILNGTALTHAAESKTASETVAVAGPSVAGQLTAVDATVEAVRQSRLASQVSGAVVALNVRVGDRVKAGQVLISLDGQSAKEQVLSSKAQLQAAESAYLASSRDFERQNRLFEKQYISQAALERAQAQKDLAQARLKAAQAQSNVAQHQSGFYSIVAPYSGLVSELNVSLGDMAMPGKPLLTVYDPSVMRLRAFVPQSWQASMTKSAQAQFSVPGDDSPQAATAFEWVPMVDSATHSVELRIPLPTGTSYPPGQFARIWLPIGSPAGTDQGRIWIPLSATIKRSELVAVYVVKPSGEEVLRQVRLGEIRGNQVEVLSGLDASERIVRQARTVNTKKDH